MALIKRLMAAALVAGYVVCGFLTGGYYANHRAEPPRSAIVMDTNPMEAVMAGVFWPVYWAGRASLWVTR